MSSPAFRMRVATLADVDALVQLDIDCFAACDRFSRRVWRHLLGSAAAAGTAITVVAENDQGQLVGSVNALLRHSSSVVRLYTLAVHQQARGQRVPNRMLATLVPICPPRCTVISLEVRADNPARAIYERWGLNVIEPLPGYYRDGADGVRMRGDLAQALVVCTAPAK